MQTIEQLLAKVLTQLTTAEDRGEKAAIVRLTSEDEMTLIIHEWLKNDIQKPPHSVRGRSAFKRLCGLDIEWGAKTTEVRAHTADEIDRIRTRSVGATVPEARR